LYHPVFTGQIERFEIIEQCSTVYDRLVEMITKFLTNISVTLNPFSNLSKSARIFLSLLPPDSRQTIKINTKLLARTSDQPPKIAVTFKDGKLVELDAGKLSIKDLVEELDRHSRILRKKEELGGN